MERIERWNLDVDEDGGDNDGDWCCCWLWWFLVQEKIALYFVKCMPHQKLLRAEVVNHNSL
jgi:hypothetical protein